MPLDTSRESGPKIFGTTLLTTGMLAALVSGSIALYGRIYIPENSTQNIIIQRGTGAILATADAQTASILTGTGGRQEYTAARITNPVTGTAVILDFGVDFDAAPNTNSLLTCHLAPSATSTATGLTMGVSNFFKYHKAQSGSTVTGSGASYPVILPDDWSVRCWFADAAPGAVRAKARAMFREQYVP